MEVQQLLQDTFVQNWRFSGLIFRSGNHLKLAHLERVATMDAAVIVLPSAREDAGLDSTVDGGTFKSLLTIGNWAKRESRRPPLAVAEILDHRKSDIAQVAYGGPLEIIPSDLYLSRLMAQILRHPGSSEVFSELLSEDIGNELYLKDSGTLIGQPFSHTFGALKTAIPIGIVSQGPQGFFCTLVPEPDHILCENDKVVVIAEDDIKSQLSEVDELKPIGPLRPPIQSTEKKLRNILILGWNRRVPLILNEFECYSRGKTTLTVLSRTPLEARLERQSHMGLDFKSVQVSHILGDYTSTTELKTYQPGSFDAIVLVASDWSDTDALTDARTILGYLVLMELLDKHRVSRPAILVELLDASNQDLFSQENCEVIVSPLIVSHFLSQVALRRELNTVFENLFCPEGAEVTIVPATSILGSTLTTSLEQVQEILFGQGGISLGFRIHEKRQIKTVLNPPRKQEFQLEINDKIIILFR
uniref:CASTOR/POLLUX/SYM8 ion channel conserved domain-containing protein n=1 Tax=Aureoumbra lagunensis TaxID=44058 RepID=A0A7S3K4H1_9STRA